MTFKYRYRKQILFLIFGILFVCGSISSFFILKPKSKKVLKNKTILLSKNIKKQEKNNNDENGKEDNNDINYKVDIKGQVNNPGMYTLRKNSRIVDVIDLAGGLTVNANTSVINLSKKIIDEMVIIIYSNEEVLDFSKTKEIESQVINNCIQKSEDSLKNDACIDKDNKDNTIKIISINNATKEELMTLNGIGESKAEDIIKYRNENGGFKTVEDIKNVKGIGESLFDKIKENITL